MVCWKEDSENPMSMDGEPAVDATVTAQSPAAVPIDHVPYADEVAQAAWWRYVVTVTGNATQSEIAGATGIDQSSISRWQRGTNTPRAEAVVSFARAYGRSPIEALVAADYLTSEDMGVVEMITLTGDLTRVSSDSLLSELRRRLLAAAPGDSRPWPPGWSADDPAVGGREDSE
jgi:transcriptional regulator with XRE-family HTH domain